MIPLKCVFENPIHSNGGCIFDDPSNPIAIVLLFKPKRVQDFNANQRLIESAETNRDLTLEEKNVKIQFNEQSRFTESAFTNRKITQGSQGKGSKFVNKNRTIH